MTTHHNIELEISRLEGLKVMYEDDRDMFGFTEEDEIKYKEIIKKLEELKR